MVDGTAARDPKPTWCAVREAFLGGTPGRFSGDSYVACDNRTLPIPTADLPKPGLRTAPYFHRVRLEDHVESACGSNEHVASTKRHKDAYLGSEPDDRGNRRERRIT